MIVDIHVLVFGIAKHVCGDIGDFHGTVRSGATTNGFLAGDVGTEFGNRFDLIRVNARGARV